MRAPSAAAAARHSSALATSRAAPKSRFSAAPAVPISSRTRELEIAVELVEHPRLRLLPLQLFGLERHVEVAVDRRELLREAGLLGVLDQPLSIALALDLRRVLEQRLERAVLRDQLRRAGLADARHAGDVVDAVAEQRHHVGHLLGRHTEVLAHALAVEALLAQRVVDRHAVVHELHQVLVEGDDGHLVSRFGSTAGDRAEHVVRLVARRLEDRDAVGLDQPADVRNLRAQVVRHRRAVRLVLGVALLAHRGAGDVERDAHQVRLLLAEQLVEHLREAEGGVGRLALAARERRQREKRSEDRRVTVDQEQALGHRRER